MSDQFARELRILDEMTQRVSLYRDLLNRTANIRSEAYGQPYYARSLLQALDTLGSSLQEATRNAVL